MISAEDTVDGGVGHRHDDDNDDDVMIIEESSVEISRSKPLSELTVGEVGTLLEAFKLGKYKETLINNEIDGKCLVECNIVEDVVNMGISIVVKARVFLNEVMIWKINGVPMELFYVDQGTIREDNDAEDMIDEVNDRTMNDDDDDDDDGVRVAAFVDSEVMQGEAGTNDNDHEDSVVDDTSIIEPVQLIELSTAEDMKELTVKTSTLLDEITKWKATEISMEYFSANQSSCCSR